MEMNRKKSGIQLVQNKILQKQNKKQCHILHDLAGILGYVADHLNPRSPILIQWTKSARIGPGCIWLPVLTLVFVGN
jgi:hypothetical protein